MKIAVVGSGISGLTAAYYLHKNHDITVFEKSDMIGGHTATKDIVLDDKEYAIDTGFIVFNEWTYPNFIKLMDELGVESQPTSMSFSLSCEKTGLEYAGRTLSSLFAQRKNIASPKFWSLILGILRFFNRAEMDLTKGSLPANITLKEYLDRGGFSKIFVDKFLIPMGCAIWSSSTEEMTNFPLLFFVRFFKNHGLLNIINKPQWRVIKCGSRSYLKPLIEGFQSQIETGAHIKSVKPVVGGVQILLANGNVEKFDQVIFACHSDQVVELLGSNINNVEKDILGDMQYKKNEVVLHYDQRLLPRERRAWASWNYLLSNDRQEAATLTYNMNMLQGFESEHTFCVTLNNTQSIDPSKILGEYQYSHPVFSLGSVKAASRWGEINGIRNLWYAGAYWGNGFHEDGVVSALKVVGALGKISSTHNVAV